MFIVESGSGWFETSEGTDFPIRSKEVCWAKLMFIRTCGLPPRIGEEAVNVDPRVGVKQSKSWDEGELTYTGIRTYRYNAADVRRSLTGTFFR